MAKQYEVSHIVKQKLADDGGIIFITRWLHYLPKFDTEQPLATVPSDPQNEFAKRTPPTQAKLDEYDRILRTIERWQKEKTTFKKEDDTALAAITDRAAHSVASVMRIQKDKMLERLKYLVEQQQVVLLDASLDRAEGKQGEEPATIVDATPEEAELRLHYEKCRESWQNDERQAVVEAKEAEKLKRSEQVKSKGKKAATTTTNKRVTSSTVSSSASSAKLTASKAAASPTVATAATAASSSSSQLISSPSLQLTSSFFTASSSSPSSSLSASTQAARITTVLPLDISSTQIGLLNEFAQQPAHVMQDDETDDDSPLPSRGAVRIKKPKTKPSTSSTGSSSSSSSAAVTASAFASSAKSHAIPLPRPPAATIPSPINSNTSVTSSSVESTSNSIVSAIHANTKKRASQVRVRSPSPQSEQKSVEIIGTKVLQSGSATRVKIPSRSKPILNTIEKSPITAASSTSTIVNSIATDEKSQPLPPLPVVIPFTAFTPPKIDTHTPTTMQQNSIEILCPVPVSAVASISSAQLNSAVPTPVPPTSRRSTALPSTAANSSLTTQTLISSSAYEMDVTGIASASTPIEPEKFANSQQTSNNAEASLESSPLRPPPAPDSHQPAESYNHDRLMTDVEPLAGSVTDTSAIEKTIAASMPPTSITSEPAPASTDASATASTATATATPTSTSASTSLPPQPTDDIIDMSVDDPEPLLFTRAKRTLDQQSNTELHDQPNKKAKLESTAKSNPSPPTMRLDESKKKSTETATRKRKKIQSSSSSGSDSGSMSDSRSSSHSGSGSESDADTKKKIVKVKKPTKGASTKSTTQKAPKSSALTTVPSSSSSSDPATVTPTVKIETPKSSDAASALAVALAAVPTSPRKKSKLKKQKSIESDSSDSSVMLSPVSSDTPSPDSSSDARDESDLRVLNDEGGEDAWYVSRLRAEKRMPDGSYKFEVKWKGFPDTTWEPEDHILNSGLIEDLRDQIRRRKERQKRREERTKQLEKKKVRSRAAAAATKTGSSATASAAVTSQSTSTKKSTIASVRERAEKRAQSLRDEEEAEEMRRADRAKERKRRTEEKQRRKDANKPIEKKRESASNLQKEKPKAKIPKLSAGTSPSGSSQQYSVPNGPRFLSRPNPSLTFDLPDTKRPNTLFQPQQLGAGSRFVTPQMARRTVQPQLPSRLQQPSIYSHSSMPPLHRNASMESQLSVDSNPYLAHINLRAHEHQQQQQQQSLNSEAPSMQQPPPPPQPPPSSMQRQHTHSPLQSASPQPYSPFPPGFSSLSIENASIGKSHSHLQHPPAHVPLYSSSLSNVSSVRPSSFTPTHQQHCQQATSSSLISSKSIQPPYRRRRMLVLGDDQLNLCKWMMQHHTGQRSVTREAAPGVNINVFDEFVFLTPLRPEQIMDRSIDPIYAQKRRDIFMRHFNVSDLTVLPDMFPRKKMNDPAYFDCVLVLLSSFAPSAPAAYLAPTPFAKETFANLRTGDINATRLSNWFTHRLMKNIEPLIDSPPSITSDSFIYPELRVVLCSCNSLDPMYLDRLTRENRVRLINRQVISRDPPINIALTKSGDQLPPTITVECFTFDKSPLTHAVMRSFNSSAIQQSSYEETTYDDFGHGDGRDADDDEIVMFDSKPSKSSLTHPSIIHVVGTSAVRQPQPSSSTPLIHLNLACASTSAMIPGTQVPASTIVDVSHHAQNDFIESYERLLPQLESVSIMNRIKRWVEGNEHEVESTDQAKSISCDALPATSILCGSCLDSHCTESHTHAIDLNVHYSLPDSSAPSFTSSKFTTPIPMSDRFSSTDIAHLDVVRQYRKDVARRKANLVGVVTHHRAASSFDSLIDSKLPAQTRSLDAPTRPFELTPLSTVAPSLRPLRPSSMSIHPLCDDRVLLPSSAHSSPRLSQPSSLAHLPSHHIPFVTTSVAAVPAPVVPLRTSGAIHPDRLRIVEHRPPSQPTTLTATPSTSQQHQHQHQPRRPHSIVSFTHSNVSSSSSSYTTTSNSTSAIGNNYARASHSSASSFTTATATISSSTDLRTPLPLSRGPVHHLPANPYHLPQTPLSQPRPLPSPQTPARPPPSPASPIRAPSFAGQPPDIYRRVGRRCRYWAGNSCKSAGCPFMHEGDELIPEKR